MLPVCSYTSVANLCLRACQQEQYNIIISVCVCACVCLCVISLSQCVVQALRNLVNRSLQRISEVYSGLEERLKSSAEKKAAQEKMRRRDNQEEDNQEEEEEEEEEETDQTLENVEIALMHTNY